MGYAVLPLGSPFQASLKGGCNLASAWPLPRSRHGTALLVGNAKRLEQCPSRESSVSAPPTGSKAPFLQLDLISPGCSPGAQKRRGPLDIRAFIRPCGPPFQVRIPDLHYQAWRSDTPHPAPEVPRVSTDGVMVGRLATVGYVPNLGTWGRRGQRTFRNSYSKRYGPGCLSPFHFAN